MLARRVKDFEKPFAVIRNSKLRLFDLPDVNAGSALASDVGERLVFVREADPKSVPTAVHGGFESDHVPVPLLSCRLRVKNASVLARKSRDSGKNLETRPDAGKPRSTLEFVGLYGTLTGELDTAG